MAGLAPSIAMVGAVSTVMLSAAVAAAAVGSAEASDDRIVFGVVEAGTTMSAVMSTEAAARRIVTADALTPAIAAIDIWRAEAF